MNLTRRTWLGAAVGLCLTGCSDSPDSAADADSPAGATAGSPASSSASTELGSVFRFATASDGHFGLAGTSYQRHLSDLVDAVNQVHAETPIEVLVLNGDLADSGQANLEAVVSGLTALDPSYLALPGNHDRVSNIDWEQVWGTEPNLVRRFGERSLILANTSDRAGKFRCVDTDWLSQVLAEESQQRDVFVFMHITPKSWTKWGQDCPEVRELLAETPNVRAVFNGHDHDQDGIKVDAGLPYLFDAHYGGDWGTDYRGFRMVEVSEAGLTTWMVTTKGQRLKSATRSW